MVARSMTRGGAGRGNLGPRLLQGRAVWMAAVILLGVLAMVLLSTDPVNEGPVGGIKTTFYPEPVAKPGYTLTKDCIGERRIWAYVLSADPLPKERRPAVILIHGGGITDLIASPKPQYKGEWFIPQFDYIPYRLAQSDMLVVAIDTWWAGDRYEPDRAKLAQDDPLAALFHGYAETARDVSQVIDYLVSRDDVDPAKIGVSGKSGGGIISLMAACKDERIEAVVAWKAGADFITLCQLRGNGVLVSRSLSQNIAFREEIQREDPIYLYEDIPPKALALIGNRDDPSMPRQAAEALYAKLQPLYTAYPERLIMKLFETPRPTHDLEPAAFELGCEWLERFLTRRGAQVDSAGPGAVRFSHDALSQMRP